MRLLLLVAAIVCIHSYVGPARVYPAAALSAKRKRKGLTAEFEQINSPVKTEGAGAKRSEFVDEVDANLRAKLKAEIATPFRKLRQFLYAGAGVAGVLGTVTAVPQLVLALQGATEKGSTSEIAINIAIDVGVIVAAVFLWDRENTADRSKVETYASKEQQLSAMLTKEEVAEREDFLGKLPVEIQVSESSENATRIVSLSDLQSKGKQNIIVVSGSAAFVKDAIMSARIEGADLFSSKDTYVVPIVLEAEQLEAQSSRGFAAKELMMSAPYIGKPTQLPVWMSYMQREVESAERQGVKDVVGQGLVLAVKQNGKVLRRGLGLPPWKEICEQFSST